QHRHRRTVAGDGDGGPGAFVVGALDRPHAIEPEVPATDVDLLTRRHRHIALDGEGLHRRDGDDGKTEPDVRDGHADHAAWHREFAPPAIDGIDERGQDDPHTERRGYRG